jgi:protein O-mannosyl-transferase
LGALARRRGDAHGDRERRARVDDHQIDCAVTARTGARPSARVPVWGAPALVVLVSLAACAAGFVNDFAQDDLHLVEANARIQSLGNLREMFASPFWPPPFSPDLYRPLTSVWLALQYAFGAGAPIVFRATSYLLYAAVCLCLFRFASRHVPRAIALCIALLFAAHPVHVEAVALAVGQNELIVALIAFGMLAVYLARRNGAGLRVRDWSLLGVLYAAAALFKETGLVLPGLLVLAELLLVQRDAPLLRRVRETWLGYICLALVAVGVLLARRAVLGGEIAGTFTAEALQGVRGGGRALTMLAVVPQWARLLIWPAHLRADYSPQEFVSSTHFGGAELFGTLLLAAALVVVVLSWRRAPVVAFGLLWCAVALLPVSNVIVPTGVLLAERTLFLPSVGFMIAVGGAAAMVAARARGLLRRLGPAAIYACAVLVAASVARSVERERVWRNDPFLSVRTVQDAPRSFRAQRAYADVLFAIGQPQLALDAYARALALAPRASVWRVRNDFARALRGQGDRSSEAVQLRQSLAERPDQDDDRGYLIAADLATGDYRAAALEADTALARGGKLEVFRGLKAIADSAARVKAPVGSIRIQIDAGGVRADRD